MTSNSKRQKIFKKINPNLRATIHLKKKKKIGKQVKKKAAENNSAIKNR